MKEAICVFCGNPTTMEEHIDDFAIPCCRECTFPTAEEMLKISPFSIFIMPLNEIIMGREN